MKRPFALLRQYRRLAPITLLQWDLARDNGTRARIIASLIHLVGVDVALAAIHRLRRLAAHPVPIYIDGLTYYVDPYANEVVPLIELHRGGIYSMVPGFVAARGQIVVDIGANIGAFALWQALQGAAVYAYEPNPASFARLSRAIARNHVEGRVHATNQAVGAVEGRAALTVPNDNTTAGTLRPDPTGPISVTTIPALCRAHGLIHIDILKIDAEGSEVSILEAAGTALDRVRNLVLEYHSPSLEDGCRRILTAHGFAVLKRIVVDAEAGAGMLYARRPAA